MKHASNLKYLEWYDAKLLRKVKGSGLRAGAKVMATITPNDSWYLAKRVNGAILTFHTGAIIGVDFFLT